MVTFTPDGRYILVANEGEPNSDYSVDPEGSVSIIDLTRGLKRATVKTADFNKFNKSKDELIAVACAFLDLNATVAQDLEPEYITILPHSPYAWVSLQENNAIAKIDIRSGRVVISSPWGSKITVWLQMDWMQVIKTIPLISSPISPVLGMYQPDSIAAYSVRGNTYIVTANEGDARDYETLSAKRPVSGI